jgi:putative intracellular protease/amidase
LFGDIEMTKRILHVVTNIASYQDPNAKTGLWLAELSLAWDVFAKLGYEQKIVSPNGGKSPLEPKSLKWPILDESSKNWLADAHRMDLLDNTLSPEQVDPKEFDAIYYTGGHGVMWDFLDNPGLQAITRGIYENGGVVSSVCHGFCGLINVKLSNGAHLVSGKRLTGFAWTEEVLAGVAKKVPYNAEEEMRKRGAIYEKNFIPFTPRVVTDGRLVTGQNPSSATKTAQAVVNVLSRGY